MIHYSLSGKAAMNQIFLANGVFRAAFDIALV